MQFRVPQFIDIEDKIVGPLTLKQFGYLLGGGGFSYLIWTFVPYTFLALILIVPVAGLFLALAFYTYNDQPFARVLESAFTYYTGSRMYTWHQPAETPVQTPANQVADNQTHTTPIAPITQERMHDISQGLDVLDTNPQAPH